MASNLLCYSSIFGSIVAPWIDRASNSYIVWQGATIFPVHKYALQLQPFCAVWWLLLHSLPLKCEVPGCLVGAWLFGAIAGLFAAQCYLLIWVQRNLNYQDNNSAKLGVTLFICRRLCYLSHPTFLRATTCFYKNAGHIALLTRN